MFEYNTIKIMEMLFWFLAAPIIIWYGYSKMKQNPEDKLAKWRFYGSFYLAFLFFGNGIWRLVIYLQENGIIK